VAAFGQVKILDTLLGRTKPVKPNLDALFSLPSAAVTLQVSAGLVPTGKAGVCFKPPSGKAFADVQKEIEQMLDLPEDAVDASAVEPGRKPSAKVTDFADSYGYHWIVIEGCGIDDLVTRVHVVHSSLEDAGWGTQLLCSVFGFGKGEDVAVSTTVYFVYLAKRGSFYPFAPTGKEQRDTELELSLRATIGSELPVEEDLARWFPLWDVPIS
jgi:hypothetical protein